MSSHEGSEEEWEAGTMLQAVEYHHVTGVPEEYHDYLPKDTEAYKRLKSHKVSEGI